MLRRSLLIGIVVVLALSTFPVPVSASAGTIQETFLGLSAYSFFSTFDGDLSTFVLVGASEGKFISQGKPDFFSYATVFILQYSYARNEMLVNEYGEVALAPGEYAVDQDLERATLDVTIPVFDEVTQTTIPVAVNLVWTATSDIRRGGSSLHYEEPGLFVATAHSSGADRQAQASGTIGGIYFAPESSYSAIIVDSVQTVVNIQLLK